MGFFAGFTTVFSCSGLALNWLSLSDAFVSRDVIEFVREGSFEVGQLESCLSRSSFVSELLSQDRVRGGLCFPNFSRDRTLLKVVLLKKMEPWKGIQCADTFPKATSHCVIHWKTLTIQETRCFLIKTSYCPPWCWLKHDTEL